jgi:hypothetical protein|tara:strand:- start:6128 stop:6709 length:582 start_codon:yes stop_codon:yes gene_type:complete
MIIINKKTCFIHIPKTAGRFIYETFKESGCELEGSTSYVMYKEKDANHLTYPEHDHYLNYMPLKKFCVVRDPVDRFLSAIKSTWFFNEEKINDMFRTQSYFDETINNYCVNNFTNWLVPQTNFIDYKTKIWRFENKFEKDFIEWVFSNFNIQITKLGNKSKYVSTNYNQINLDSKKIKYIKDYYYKDYKLLDY